MTKLSTDKYDGDPIGGIPRDGATNPVPRKNKFSPKVKIVVAVLAVIYGISPVDLAPELLLGPVGLVDDVGVLIATVIFMFLRSSSPKTEEKKLKNVN